MKNNKIVGRVEPFLKYRIDNVKQQIDNIYEMYFPKPPAHLKSAVYEVLWALYARLKILSEMI